MEKVILDTCFLCSLLNKNDINNSLAVRIAENLKDCIAIVPTVVIAELMSNFKNKQTRDSTVKAIFKIVDDMPSLNSDNVDEYVKFTQKINHSFTAVDSIILFHAKDSNTKLITFDKKLLKIYNES